MTEERKSRFCNYAPETNKNILTNLKTKDPNSRILSQFKNKGSIK